MVIAVRRPAGLSPAASPLPHGKNSDLFFYKRQKKKLDVTKPRSISSEQIEQRKKKRIDLDPLLLPRRRACSFHAASGAHPRHRPPRLPRPRLCFHRSEASTPQSPAPLFLPWQPLELRACATAGLDVGTADRGGPGGFKIALYKMSRALKEGHFLSSRLPSHQLPPPGPDTPSRRRRSISLLHSSICSPRCCYMLLFGSEVSFLQVEVLVLEGDIVALRSSASVTFCSELAGGRRRLVRQPRRARVPERGRTTCSTTPELWRRPHRLLPSQPARRQARAVQETASDLFLATANSLFEVPEIFMIFPGPAAKEQRATPKEKQW